MWLADWVSGQAPGETIARLSRQALVKLGNNITDSMITFGNKDTKIGLAKSTTQYHGFSIH